LADQYRPVAGKLIDAALADTEGYNRLAWLCYRHGSRLSVPRAREGHRVVGGTDESAGLSNVRIIPAKVPHWERGGDRAA